MTPKSGRVIGAAVVSPTARPRREFVPAWPIGHLALLLEHAGMAETLARRASNPEIGIRTLHIASSASWGVPLVPLAEQRELATVLTATRRAIRAADRARRDVLYALAQEIVGPLVRRDSGDGDEE